MRIGLKYCGGCNPEYDRVALVRHLEVSLKGKAEFVLPPDRDVDIILAVNGCSIACADVSLFQQTEIRTITSFRDGEDFIKEVESMNT